MAERSILPLNSMLRQAVALALGTALLAPPLAACDLARVLDADVPGSSLWDAAQVLATASGCRILLAAEIGAKQAPVMAGGTRVDFALDQISIALDLNWRRNDTGELQLVPAQTVDTGTHSTDTLVIEAKPDAPRLPSPIEQARLPGERSPALARTTLGESAFEDDALNDYTTAIARAPGVYGMASSDVIRGIGASRLSPSQRASLLTLDGIPLPAEAWLFNRPGLGLVHELQITRSGTGLASAFGAGAGDLAMSTRAPAADAALSFGLSHAPVLAPQAWVSATGDLNVPGLKTSISISRQIGRESIDQALQPDVFHQHQYAARVAWESPLATHRLQASVLDFQRADFGGAEAPCGGGQPHCVLGADIDLDGRALTWQWQISERWRVQAMTADSASRAAVLRNDQGQLLPAQPAFVTMRHADLRVELQPNARDTFTFGWMQARRDYRLHESRRFAIHAGTAATLGMVPATPGSASLAYAHAETARTDLPQVYAEWRFDDGVHWDGHIGLRAVVSDSASHLAVREIEALNCALADGHHQGLRTCSEALRAMVHARNRRLHHRDDLLLPNAALRWRAAEDQWLALQWRDGFLGSDMQSLSLSPDAAVERLRSIELAWHRPLAERLEMEWRVFHHDWRDRVANLVGDRPDALTFDSRIIGSEWRLGSIPHPRGEWWIDAAGLKTRSNLDVLERDDVAVRGAPAWTLGLGGRWRFRNGVYFGGHFGHAEPTWIVNDDARSERLPSRDLLDLRIGVRGERLDLSLWGTNLLDDDYIVDSYGRSILLTPYHAFDRVVGIDLRAEF